MLESFMSMFGLGNLGMESVVLLFVGACIGWCVPQPAFADTAVNFFCHRFNLSKFHKKGHHHSDQCEEISLEASDENKDVDVIDVGARERTDTIEIDLDGVDNSHDHDHKH